MDVRDFENVNREITVERLSSVAHLEYCHYFMHLTVLLLGDVIQTVLTPIKQLPRDSDVIYASHSEIKKFTCPIVLMVKVKDKR